MGAARLNVQTAARPALPRIDVTGRIKSLIARSTARPAESMFRIWDRLSVIHGPYSSEDINYGARPNDHKGVMPVYSYNEVDSLEIGPRHIYPTEITGLTIFSGGRIDLSDPQEERHFASRVMLEATKAAVVMRLLDANKFGTYFSYKDIDRLDGTDGYFSWFAILKAMDEQESFLYDRTNLAFGAMRAFSGGFVTIAQNKENGQHDRDTVIKTILSKFPFLRGEFNMATSVFHTLYAAPNQSPIVTGVRASVVNALKYLMAAEPTMAGVPFDMLDEMTQSHATILIEETGHFLANLRRKFPSMTNWFLISPLGQTDALPHPMAGEGQLLRGMVCIPNRTYVVQNQGSYPTGRFDATDIVVPVIKEKSQNYAALMPEIDRMTIMQGNPNAQEIDRSIKDKVSGKEYLSIDYEYATGPVASNPNRRYPIGIKHCTYFSGDEDSVSPENIGEFADCAVFKAIQLKVLGRLLEANKRGDYFSESDLKAILRSDAYIPWMSFLALLRDMSDHKFDSNMVAGLPLAIFLIGNNNFGSEAAEDSNARQISGILNKVPGLAEEFDAYGALFNKVCVDKNTGDPADIERKQNISYATVRCIEQNEEMQSEHWDEWNPSLKNDCHLLYAEAKEFLAALKGAFQSREGWLMGSEATQYPLILPEVRAKAPEAQKEETVPVPAALNGDDILRVLKDGFEQSRDPFLMVLACEALESLSAFGGREKYWILPEISALDVAVPERTEVSADAATSILAQRLAAAEAEKVRKERERLSAIQYAARCGLGSNADIFRLVAGRLEDDGIMEVARANISSGDALTSSLAARIMLRTPYIRTLYEMPENDPPSVFEVIRQTLSDHLNIIFGSLSAGLTKGKRPIGLAKALVDFIGQVLDGDNMAVAFYFENNDYSKEPALIEEKYDQGLIDKLPVAPIVTSLALELREINGQIKPSAVEALLAAEKLLLIDKETGYFSSRRANVDFLSESFELARRSLEGHVRSGSGGDAIIAASALARLKDRNKELDRAIFGLLFEGKLNGEYAGYRVGGLSALAADDSTGIYEELSAFTTNPDDFDRAVLSSYVITAGIGSLKYVFDVNFVPLSEMVRVFSEAGVPNPEKMAKHVVSNRPYVGISGFSKKKVNGIGQNKEAIANVLSIQDTSVLVKELIFKALCSRDPVLTAMAINASNYLRIHTPAAN